MNSIEEVFRRISATQDPNWNGECSCTDCYWNMWHPDRTDTTTCVSESLGDTKMMPDTTDCPSYWSYEVACGIGKGKWASEQIGEGKS